MASTTDLQRLFYYNALGLTEEEGASLSTSDLELMYAQAPYDGGGGGGGVSVTDANVAAVVNEPATAAAIDARVDSRAVSRGEIVVDPRDFGAIGDAHLRNGTGTDDTTAIQAALDFAHNTTFIPASTARRIHLTGYFRVSGDLVINDNYVSMSGEGHGSGLVIDSGGLVIDARINGHIWGNSITNMSIRRVGTSGPAVDVVGGAMLDPSEPHPTRWTLDKLHIMSPGGIALRLRGTYLGLCSDLYLREATTGLVIEGDPVSDALSANAITFTGGEIQAVDNIGTITHALGVTFHGMAWEGGLVSGMDVNHSSGISIFGAYWEANRAFDLRVGNDGEFCSAIIVQGGYAGTGYLAGEGKDRSIILRNAYGVTIMGMMFNEYDDSPIVVDEYAGTGQVHGSESNNFNSRQLNPVSESITSGIGWNKPPSVSTKIAMNERPGSYTVTNADTGKLIRINSSTAATVTIPSATFEAGERFDIIQTGTGSVTIEAESGLTLLGDGPTFITRAQWSIVSVVFLSGMGAVVVGDLA